VDVLVSRRYQDAQIEEAHRYNMKVKNKGKRSKAASGGSERGRRAWGELACVEEGEHAAQGQGRIGQMGMHGRKFESKRVLGMKQGRSTNEVMVNNSGSAHNKRPASPVRSPSRGESNVWGEAKDGQAPSRGGNAARGARGTQTRRDGEKERGFDKLDDKEVRGGAQGETSKYALWMLSRCTD
jgi:hypothetical protein